MAIPQLTPRRERSRSPHLNTEKISRALTCICRYPDRRPAGLKEDAEGFFSIEDLAEFWGSPFGISAEDILNVVSQNLYQTATSTLRYEVREDRRGRVLIKAQPPRGLMQVPGRLHQLGSNLLRRVDWDDAPPRPRHSRRVRQEALPWQAHVPRVPPSLPARRAREEPAKVPMVEKLDMALEDVINIEGREQVQTSEQRRFQRHADLQREERPQRGDFPDARQTQRDNCRRSLAQMGLLPGTQGIRLPARNFNGERVAKRGHVEELTRCISWLLQKGHMHHGFRCVQGWAKLSDVAAAVGVARPYLDLRTEEQLRDILSTHDTVGRFELKDGMIRKVPHCDRRPQRPGPHSTGGDGAEGAVLEISSGDDMRHADDRMKDPVSDEDDEALARQCANLRVSGEVEELPLAAAEVFPFEYGAPQEEAARASTELEATDEAIEQPPRPPGEGWTLYDDQEKGNWWYYEGPLGKWMVDPHSNELKQFPE